MEVPVTITSHEQQGVRIIQPTLDQAFACLGVCQMLSNLLRDIVVFRFSNVTGEVFILTIEVVVKRNGIWEFTNET